jgi:DNA-directed RNA polymerase specialized sigma24 family protein
VIATSRHSEFDAEVSAPPRQLTSRTAFDEFYERWMPRVYRFVARRLRTRAEAEAVTRAALEAAVRAGFAAEDAALATSLLSFAGAEIARRRGLLL